MDRNQAKSKINTNGLIACLGRDGSFSHIVAQRLHPAWQTLSHASIDDIGKSIVHGKCAIGILPIENSTAGTIQETFDTIVRHKLSIIKEVFLPVAHHLLVRVIPEGTGTEKLHTIKTIFSHYKAFEQCRTFLQSLTKVHCVVVNDTASAAELVASHRDPCIAAIGSMEAAQKHKLQVLIKNIQNDTRNCTRFVVVQKQKGHMIGTKATICVMLPHVPGSLHRLLGLFAKQNLNLTHIESRPIKDKPWEYQFTIDLEIANDAHEISKSLLEAHSTATTLTIIGIYEKGVHL